MKNNINKNGFTLVELLVVIGILALLVGIAIPGVSKASENTKKKTLSTKIKNIQKEAVLYSYDEDTKITFSKYDNTCTDNSNCGIYNDLCNGISSCYYSTYDNGGSFQLYITVKDLIDLKYIEPDEIDSNNEGIVTDPTETYTNLNNCHVRIYKKYKKIYAVLDKNYC